MDTTIWAYDVEAWTRVASSRPAVTIVAPSIITIFWGSRRTRTRPVS